MKDRELIRRARALGVQTEFTDSSGAKRTAGSETLRAAIELLGQPAATPESVRVAWNGRFRSEERGVIQCEDGSEIPMRGGVTKLPLGYHRFITGNASALVISAAAKAYAPGVSRTSNVERRTPLSSTLDSRLSTSSNVRLSGVFVPMYALRSKASWGAGNLSDWQRLCEALNPRSVVATLPLLGAFLEKWKCEPSPYSPATRLFWNEFYLDVTRVPEFATSKAAQQLVNSTAFQRDLAALRDNELVDYEREMRLKRRVLEKLATEFFAKRSERRAGFEAFLKQRPELERYAAFRATCEKHRESWRSWPQRLRDGALRRGDYDADTARYFAFTQWLAQEQMDAVLASCRQRGVKFYLDLPLGVNPDGYDVWANQNLFVNNASVGAPPDAFFTKGQDWGFPPLHPQRVREDGYRYVIEYLRFQMRHTGLLRLDHVMGLHRLWWVPRGASAADGVYVRYKADELYAILCLESQRHQTMLVGENLGTVPPEVNRSMKRHGLRTMYVVQYEVQPNAKKPLREPPRDCVASLNTHDMPMWAAFWKGLDIADRRKLGLIKASEASEERKRRGELRKVLEKFLRKRRARSDAPYLTGAVSARSVLRALIKFLARSEAEVVLVNLEDLWLETIPQNTPGTSTERVNWKRKAKLSLEELLANRDLRELLEALKR